MKKILGYFLMGLGLITMFFSEEIVWIIRSYSYIILGREFTFLNFAMDLGFDIASYAIGLALAALGMFIGKIDLPEKKKN